MFNNDENIFNYFKPIIPTIKSHETLNYDLMNTLNISKSKAYNLYKIYYNVEYTEINENNCLSLFINNFNIEKENYDKYLITNKENMNTISNFFYSISCSSFIYFWIENYKKYMDELSLENIQKIITVNFDNNDKINNYIKKSLLKNELINYSNKKFMKFYDYCRLQFLLQIIMKDKNCVPKMYNPTSGILYFTSNKRINWEHIFEGINRNYFTIKFHPIIINTEYGLISNGKKNNKMNKMENELFINNDIPNYVRYMIEYILLKNKNIKNINEVKNEAYKKCIMTEDFCKKSFYGYTMSLPTKNSWQELGGVELRKISKSSVNLNTIYETYNSTLLNPILQACWG